MPVFRNSISYSPSGDTSIESRSATTHTLLQEEVSGENDVFSAVANRETMSGKRSISNEETSTLLASTHEHQSENESTKRSKKNVFRNWFNL